MIFCFGTVCWNGYLEKYIDIFVNNYITIYRKLIGQGVNHANIIDPKVCYSCYGDMPGPHKENAIKKLEIAIGKKLKLICYRNKYTI